MAVNINGTTGLTFNNGSTQAVGAVGDGQTWQNLTGSRSSGTTYTNSTGKPIMIAVTCTRSADVARITITVDGLAIGSSWTGNSDVEQRAFVTTIVPNGSTYSASALTGSIFSWYELR